MNLQYLLLDVDDVANRSTVSGSKEWRDVRCGDLVLGPGAIVTPTDALMGGLISLLSGTLVVLWLVDAEKLRLACGIVLGCYLVGVLIATHVLSRRHLGQSHRWMRSLNPLRSHEARAKQD
jgi:hypothetical protein